MACVCFLILTVSWNDLDLTMTEIVILNSLPNHFHITVLLPKKTHCLWFTAIPLLFPFHLYHKQATEYPFDVLNLHLAQARDAF
jgi:hypothetical protein